MAKHPVGNFSVTVVGKGEYIDVRSFIETVRDAIEALCDVDESVSSVEGGSLSWQIVDATTNSPLTLSLQSVSNTVADFSEQVVDAFIDGIEQIDKDGTHPRHFPPKAIKAVQRFAEHYSNGVTQVTFVSKTRRYSPSGRLSENVSRIADTAKIANASGSRPDYFEHGSLEGTVESLIGHNQLYFSLYEPLSGARIRCNFKASLNEEVRAAWQKRVIVDGRIRISGDGTPKDISVKRVALKLGSEELPQFKGAYIDITGGVESSEYVRGMRDDD